MSNDAPWYEEIAFPAMLRPARTTYGLAMHRALAEIGCDDVPRNGLWVIGGLARGADSIPLGELVRDLRVSKQAAGQLVDTLVLRGYLERTVDAEDRRKLTVSLTARGKAAAAAQRAAGERIDAELLARVGADRIAHARETLAALMVIGREQEHAEEE